MSRVQAVVNQTIMVRFQDINPGKDVLSIDNSERDPIIERVEFDGNEVRLHYKHRSGDDVINESFWMDARDGEACVFLHDLLNEREGFIGSDWQWPNT